MLPGKPTNKIKTICSQLGEPYIIKTIDNENVIYRALDTGYEFEATGLDHGGAAINAIIYVWEIANHNNIEIVSDITSLIELKDVLGALALKYQRNADWVVGTIR